MDREQDEKQLQQIVDKLGIGNYERHIIFCAGEKCCSAEQGLEVWQYLKTRLKELNLANGIVYRTKASCMRICAQGPIALVYPEGTWYRNVNRENIERIIQEHLINGREVKDLMFAENPMLSDV